MKNESEWQTQIAEQNAADALTNARGTLMRALQELDSYIEKFDAANSPARKAEALNWECQNFCVRGGRVIFRDC